MSYYFSLDMDHNGMLSLTEKNVQLISSILRVDPRCSDASRGVKGSVKQHFRSYGITQERYELYEIVMAINRIPYFYPDTSIASVLRVVDAINGIDDLEDRLRRGDSSLVEEITKATPGDNIYFASEFCAYACVYVLGEDNYIIYDTVIGDVLPYYAYYHLKENYMDGGRSVWPSLIMQKDGYDYYRGLIRGIIDDVAEKSGYTMTFLEFYNTLWYYYRGSGRERMRMIAKKMRGLRGSRDYV